MLLLVVFNSLDCVCNYFFLVVVIVIRLYYYGVDEVEFVSVLYMFNYIIVNFLFVIICLELKIGNYL